MIDRGEIKHYDNKILLDDREKIFEFCMNSEFRLGWKDSPFDDELFLHNIITGSPAHHLLDNYYRGEIFKDELNGYEPVQSVLNCGVPGAINKGHRDQYDNHKHTITVLYFANRTWNKGWGGETKFWDPYSEDLMYVSEYIPGRTLIFDGEIPHCAGTFSFKADYWRFTIAHWYVPAEFAN